MRRKSSVATLFGCFVSLPLNVQALPVQASPVELRAVSGVTGPMLGVNFPDPCIFEAGETWYAFATRPLGGTINVQGAQSSDGRSWQYMQGFDAMPSLPPWVSAASPNVWAPDVQQLFDGSFVLYFSASTGQDPSKHCVGAAKSNSPTGPFEPLAQPLVCPLAQGGAIDAAGFADSLSTTKEKRQEYIVATINGDVVSWPNPYATQAPEAVPNAAQPANAPAAAPTAPAAAPQTVGSPSLASTGSRYVVYKVDGTSLDPSRVNGAACVNAPYASTALMLQPVAADGVTLIGSPTKLLDHDGAADMGSVEAPQLVKTSSGYTLLFSSGCYQSNNYTVSYATSSSVLGPYTRQGALMSTSSMSLLSPGGAQVSADGTRMVFHASQGSWTNRQMFEARVQFTSNSINLSAA